MIENDSIKKSLLNKTRISNLFLVVPICIAIAMLLASVFYWSPHSGEEIGTCVKRAIGHGTFFVDQGLASNGDFYRVLLDTKEPHYSHLCQ